MSNTNQFEADQLQKTAEELAAVREAAKAQAERLAQAEEALRYYGNPKSYEITRKLDGNKVYQDRLKADFYPSDNDPNTHLAGRKAREYFRRYEPK